MKKSYCIILTFLCFSFAHSQIGFENQVIMNDSDITKTPSRVVSADIDGDGDIDVISAASTKISWYENSDGLGHFLFPKIVTTNVSDAGSYDSNSVQVGDFDNDGDIDIISVTYNKIAWYQNTDGKGNFGAQQVIVNSGGSWGFSKIGDIDGDGDIDILASSSSSSDNNGGGVRWFENTDGLGSFILKQIVTTDGGNDIDLADLDGDGDQDIVLGGFEYFHNDHVVIYENIDGNGTFGPEIFVPGSKTSSLSYIRIYVSTGDIDNDGDIDIVYGQPSSDRVSLAINEGVLDDFTFQSVTSSLESAGPVEFGDIDGDGDLDIHVTADDSDIVWYENTDGLGDFSVQNTVISNDSGLGIPHLFDLDNDNDIDFMYYSRYRKIGWRENINGEGDFSEEKIITSSIYRINDVFSSDLDGDGDKDIITTYSYGISWFPNEDGKGNFTEQRVISKLLGANSVFSTDLDGDNDMDILSASDDGIVWHENNGQGHFITEQNVGTTVNGSAVLAGDIDNDGDSDIIYIIDTNDNHKIAWAENIDGNGNFGPEQVISTEILYGNTLFIADLDGDGDNDVLSASTGDSKIAWYENINGNGEFGNQQIITTSLGEGNDVFAADMDNDNDLDIICACGNSVSLFNNTNGLGSFTLQQTYLSEEGYGANGVDSVSATDIDNDGDNDIIIGTDFNFSVYWLRNGDGQGTLLEEQIISEEFNNEILKVCTDDINGDNKIDIIAISSSDTSGSFISTNLDINYHQLIWYSNEGFLTNEINGQINYDHTNSGCTSESQPIPNILIETTNDSETISTSSFSNGFYNIPIDEGNYVTSIRSELPDYFTVTPSSLNSNFSGIGNIDSNSFCIEPNQVINDLNISIIPLTPEARPGFDTSYKIVFSNAGTTTQNGTIIFEYDNTKLNLLNSSEVINSSTSNTLNFDFVNLNPFESRTINLDFNIFPPPTVNIDEILSFEASISPVLDDFTEDDNLFNFNQTVIGSYDPNDITVLEGSEILFEEVDHYLHYVIRFQNTGTASAIKVKVDNVLDEKLNWDTFQLQSTSHDVKVEIKNGNEVSFIFDAIYLADSTSDELNSHGFIAYKIKPNNNVQIGNIISSVANIYFDFNPPIITNNAFTEITDDITLSIEEFNTTSYTLTPNPVDNVLTFKSKETISSLKIYSISGKLFQEINLSNNNNEVDISFLPRGIYFIKIKTDKGSGVSKIIKN